MILAIGPYRYEVRLVHQRLHLNQRETLAICDHPAREVLVSSQVTQAQFSAILEAATQRIVRHRFAPMPATETATPTQAMGIAAADALAE